LVVIPDPDPGRNDGVVNVVVGLIDNQTHLFYINFYTHRKA